MRMILKAVKEENQKLKVKVNDLQKMIFRSSRRRLILLGLPIEIEYVKQGRTTKETSLSRCSDRVDERQSLRRIVSGCWLDLHLL